MNAQDIFYRGVSWRRAVALAALPAFLLAWGLGNPFIFDDFPTVLANPRLREPANIVWGWFTIHRAPVYTLHTLEYTLWGAWPAGFRFVNALFHLGIAWCLYRGGQRMLPILAPHFNPEAAERVPFGGALLFAVHPLALTVAGTISARADLMASFFFLAAFLNAWRWGESKRLRDAVAGLACAILSVWAKPSAAGLLLLAGGLFLRQRTSFQKGGGIVLAAGAAALALALYKPVAALARQTDWIGYLAAQPGALSAYAALLPFPRGLRIDHDAHIDPGASPWMPGVLLLGAMVFLAVRLKDRRPAAAFFLAWFLVAVAPTSLAPLLDVRNDSRAYLALAAFSFALSCGIETVGERFSRRAGARLLALFLAFFVLQGGWLLARRGSLLHAWSDNERWTPTSPRVLANLGEALHEQKDYRRAIHPYRASLGLDHGVPLDEARPASASYGPVLANLGHSLYEIGDGAGAVIAYQKSLTADPANSDALFNLANLFSARREHKIAAMHLEVYLRERPDDLVAVNLLAISLARSGKEREAEEWWRYLLALRPGDPVVLNNIANLCATTGRHEEAIRLYEETLAADGSSAEAIPTLRNLLAALAKAGRPAEEAETVRARLTERGVQPDDLKAPDEPLWR